MQFVSKYSFPVLIKMLNCKNVHMISDCDFFPNFNITGQVIGCTINGNELLFKIKTTNKPKIIDVGSNMKNLQFEIV